MPTFTTKAKVLAAGKNSGLAYKLKDGTYMTYSQLKKDEGRRNAVKARRAAGKCNYRLGPNSDLITRVDPITKKPIKKRKAAKPKGRGKAAGKKVCDCKGKKKCDKPRRRVKKTGSAAIFSAAQIAAQKSKPLPALPQQKKSLPARTASLAGYNLNDDSSVRADSLEKTINIYGIQRTITALKNRLARTTREYNEGKATLYELDVITSDYQYVSSLV